MPSAFDIFTRARRRPFRAAVVLLAAVATTLLPASSHLSGVSFVSAGSSSGRPEMSSPLTHSAEAARPARRPRAAQPSSGPQLGGLRRPQMQWALQSLLGLLLLLPTAAASSPGANASAASAIAAAAAERLNLTMLPSFEKHPGRQCRNGWGGPPSFFAKKNTTQEECRDACIWLRSQKYGYDADGAKDFYGRWGRWGGEDAQRALPYFNCFAFQHWTGPDIPASMNDGGFQFGGDYRTGTCTNNHLGQCMLFSGQALPPYVPNTQASRGGYLRYTGSRGKIFVNNEFFGVGAPEFVNPPQGFQAFSEFGFDGRAVSCYGASSGPCDLMASDARLEAWNLFMDMSVPYEGFFAKDDLGLIAGPNFNTGTVEFERSNGTWNPNVFSNFMCNVWSDMTAVNIADKQACFGVCIKVPECACATWVESRWVNGLWTEPPRMSTATPQRCYFSYNSAAFSAGWTDSHTVMHSFIKPTPAPTPSPTGAPTVAPSALPGNGSSGGNASGAGNESVVSAPTATPTGAATGSPSAVPRNGSSSGGASGEGNGTVVPVDRIVAGDAARSGSARAGLVGGLAGVAVVVVMVACARSWKQCSARTCLRRLRDRWEQKQDKDDSRSVPLMRGNEDAHGDMEIEMPPLVPEEPEERASLLEVHTTEVESGSPLARGTGVARARRGLLKQRGDNLGQGSFGSVTAARPPAGGSVKADREGLPEWGGFTRALKESHREKTKNGMEEKDKWMDINAKLHSDGWFADEKTAGDESALSANRPRSAAHPFLVRFFGQCFRSDGSVVLEFERMQSDLTQPLTNGTFADNAHLHILFAVQMSCAIRFLHEKLKVIHRDIKPENVLCTFFPGASDDGAPASTSARNSGYVTFKLCDFGTGKMNADFGTQTHTFAGTADYQAPELQGQHYQAPQLRDGDGDGDDQDSKHSTNPESLGSRGSNPEEDRQLRLSRAIDWWSFGCVLFEVVYGEGYYHQKTGSRAQGMIPQWPDEFDAEQIIVVANLETRFRSRSSLQRATERCEDKISVMKRRRLTRESQSAGGDVSADAETEALSDGMLKVLLNKDPRARRAGTDMRRGTSAADGEDQGASDPLFDLLQTIGSRAGAGEVLKARARCTDAVRNALATPFKFDRLLEVVPPSPLVKVPVPTGGLDEKSSAEFQIVVHGDVARPHASADDLQETYPTDGHFLQAKNGGKQATPQGEVAEARPLEA